MNIKKHFPKIVTIILLFVSITGCVDKEWKNHYSDSPERVNVKMWDAIQDSSNYSTFIRLVRQAGMDTILTKNQGFTLFIPSNEAFEGFASVGENLNSIIGYHIAQTIITEAAIGSGRRIQTFNGKFATLSTSYDGIYFDGVKISKGSPLFADGMIYELDKVIYPRKNLYEQIAVISPIVKRFIDSQNFKAFNLAESKPLGFNAEGDILYDSVFDEYNFFEMKYFSNASNYNILKQNDILYFSEFQKKLRKDPTILKLLAEPTFALKNEYRNVESSMLLFSDEQYKEAMNGMFKELDIPGITDYRDVPSTWIERRFYPYIFFNSIFKNRVSAEDLLNESILNYNQMDALIKDFAINREFPINCSNGVIYKFSEFEIPTSLYKDTLMVQGENLVVSKGENKYSWKEDVKSSHAEWAPEVTSLSAASNGRILSVPFSGSFAGPFSITFKFKDVWPRKYILQWQAPYRPSGLVKWYVNGTPVGSFDNYDWVKFTVDNVTKERRVTPASSGLNYQSFLVENVKQYGDVEITAVWTKGKNSAKGLMIDFVSLLPYQE